MIFKFLIGILLIGTSIGCFSQKKSKSIGEEIITLCNGTHSDAHFFRAGGSGEDLDPNIAQNKAMINAYHNLFSYIQSKREMISKPYDTYSEDFSKGYQPFESLVINTLIRKDIESVLSDYVIITCKELYKINNTYECWLAIEVTKDLIILEESAKEQVKKNEILYDITKWEEKFKKEMKYWE